MKKSIIFIITLLVSFVNQQVKADQLSYLSKNDAIRAVNLLEKQPSVVLWCACCSNEAKKVVPIKEVFYEYTGYENFYQVNIRNSENNEVFEGVDLAYTHINKNGKAVCVGKELFLECDPCTLPFNYPNSSNNSFSQGDNFDIEEYFSVFLNKNGNDLSEVFLQHQPTLNDCKIVFTSDFYTQAFQQINQIFGSIGEQIEIQNDRFKNKTTCRATIFNTNNVLKGNCDSCPGILMQIKDKFNPNIEAYNLKFLDNKAAEYGSSYSFFTFINGRWVYFPMN